MTRSETRAYYSAVADQMLLHLRNRPLTLIVCPTNIYACKFKKHATKFLPPVRSIEVAGHEEGYIAVDSPEGLLALVDAGAVEFHGWQSRSTSLEYPDRILFDLDPPEIGQIGWESLGEAALLLRLHLQERGLESFIQTSGGKGYYVVAPLVPMKDWKAITGFARRFAEEMAALYPDRFVAKMDLALRQGRIYIDWMRNGRGANAAEPFSLRARPGAPIAMPISWEELVGGVRPDSFTLSNVNDRLAKPGAWEAYFAIRQTVP